MEVAVVNNGMNGMINVGGKPNESPWMFADWNLKSRKDSFQLPGSQKPGFYSAFHEFLHPLSCAVVYAWAC